MLSAAGPVETLTLMARSGCRLRVRAFITRPFQSIATNSTNFPKPAADAKYQPCRAAQICVDSYFRETYGTSVCLRCAKSHVRCRHTCFCSMCTPIASTLLYVSTCSHDNNNVNTKQRASRTNSHRANETVFNTARPVCASIILHTPIIGHIVRLIGAVGASREAMDDALGRGHSLSLVRTTNAFRRE